MFLRYHRRKNIYTDFLLPLADAAEQLDNRQTKEWDDFRQKIQPFEKHLRNLFAEEISSALITPGTEQVLDILVKLEWMAMEYAVLLQVLFLQQRKARFPMGSCGKVYV